MTPRRPRRRADERGVGTVLTLGAALALLAVTWAACVLTVWVAQVVRAQDAADLASLAGATAMAEGQDPCVAAEHAAARNEAEVINCRVRGDARAFVVEVEVRRELSPQVVGGPDAVVRRAAAGTL